MEISRRRFLQQAGLATGGLILPRSCATASTAKGQIMTVKGWIPADQLGTTLIHEHLLVDFIGANETGYDRWDREVVLNKITPYLHEIKALDIKSFIECTPAYLGRDPRLLLQAAENTGLQILTNTGYYGAVDFKYLPPQAFHETAQQLAGRWIREFEEGIEDTGIRPGFIKISVNGKSLVELEEKLVEAAARTHLATGLTIASHTGPAVAAYEEIELLRSFGVHPSAFIWVHAQNEKDISQHLAAAREGAWISLDGLNDNNTERYLEMVANLKSNGLLARTLISHDAGWYRPGEAGGGSFRAFTTLSKVFIPALRSAGFTSDDVDQLLVKNPAEAFTVKRRPRN